MHRLLLQLRPYRGLLGGHCAPGETLQAECRGGQEKIHQDRRGQDAGAAPPEGPHLQEHVHLLRPGKALLHHLQRAPQRLPAIPERHDLRLLHVPALRAPACRRRNHDPLMPESPGAAIPGRLCATDGWGFRPPRCSSRGARPRPCRTGWKRFVPPASVRPAAWGEGGY